jgi:hypothetical protein
MRLHKTVILPAVLHGFETWSLTLREEHRLRVFENRVLRRIFVPKRDEVTAEWRELHNDELRDLYSSPTRINNEVEKGKIDRACSTNERGMNVKYWRESQKERNHWEDQDVRRRIILRSIIER